MPLAELRGGSERMLLDLVEHREEDALRLVVILLDHGPMEEQLVRAGVRPRVVEAGRMRQLHRLAGTAARIASIARAEGATLVLGWMAKGQVYAGLAATIAGLRSAWYQLGMPAASSTLDRLATALPAEAVITCSRASAEAQRRLSPQRAVRVAYPGADLRRFDPGTLPAPDEAKRMLGLPPGRLVGIVGRLQHWKGMHVLIEALPLVLARCPDAHCAIVGGPHELEPEYQRDLERQIARLGLAERVLLTGLRSDVPVWIQAMDVVVHASDNEPFGIVVVEAMALGKPIVAAASGGPLEIVTQGRDGLLTPFGDADALARAILRYFEDPAFALSTGREAFDRARAFSTVRYARDLSLLLRELALSR